MQRIYDYAFTGNEHGDDDYIESYNAIILIIGDSAPTGNAAKPRNNLMCNYSSKQNISFSNVTGRSIGFDNASSFWKFGSSEQLKQWLSEKYEAGTPLVIQYILAEPIETDLTPEEIAAYAALHTNYPTTVITNDTGAHMAVSYVADTKAYIDTKFQELQTALANTQAQII